MHNKKYKKKLSEKFIKVFTSQGCAFVVLDRLEKRNAYNLHMLEEILKAIEFINSDKDISVVFFKSASNEVFCAGADLNEISNRSIEEILILKSQKVFEKINQMSVVSVAAIEGDAVGGGLELALACDIRVAGPNSRFWLPETKFGLIPAAGGIEKLPVLMGLSLSNDMILTGRKLSAQEALQFGLISRLISDKNFEDELFEMGIEICSRNKLANQIAKHILYHRAGFSNSAAIHNISQAFLTLMNQRESPKPDLKIINKEV